MTPIDLLITLVVVAGAMRGFFTGLVRPVIGLAGLILAFLLGVELMSFVGAVVAPMLGLGETAARVVGFVIVFLAVQILVILVTRLSESVTGALRLTLLNRAGGALFGGISTVLFVSIALVLLARVGVPNAEQQRESLLYGPTVLLVPSAWDLVAEVWPHVRTLSARFGDEVRSYWTEGEGTTPAAEP